MTDPGAPASRPGPDPSARLRRWTWTIVGGYALVAALWIRFSDDALAALVPDRAALVRWGTAKGLFDKGLVAIDIGENRRLLGQLQT